MILSNILLITLLVLTCKGIDAKPFNHLQNFENRLPLNTGDKKYMNGMIAGRDAKNVSTIIAEFNHFASTPTYTRPPQGFANRLVRLTFIRRVYAIFAAQVLATIILTGSLFRFPRLLQFFYRNYKAVGVISLAASMGSNFALVGSASLRHTFPTNFILLAISTLAQAIPVGIFATFFDPLTVCLGSMHTLTIFVALSIFAAQPNPRWDLTLRGQWLLTALVSLVIGVPLLQWLGLPIKDNLVAALIAMVFAGYIVYDTQMIVGDVNDTNGLGSLSSPTGRKKKQLAPNEHILAALLLYQDVMGMFVELLKILGYMRENSKNSRSRRDDTW